MRWNRTGLRSNPFAGKYIADESEHSVVLSLLRRAAFLVLFPSMISPLASRLRFRCSSNLDPGAHSVPPPSPHQGLCLPVYREETAASSTRVESRLYPRCSAETTFEYDSPRKLSSKREGANKKRPFGLAEQAYRDRLVAKKGDCQHIPTNTV